MLEINNTLTKIKNAFGVLLSRLDMIEKKMKSKEKKDEKKITE